MQSKQHAVSIIIPTLNEEGVVGNLLADLAAQTYQDFEVLVVDGSSEDGTRAEATRFASQLPQLSVLRTTKRNVSYQRNTGANKAASDWLIFMDADNRLDDDFLEKLVEVLRQGKRDIYLPWVSTRSKHPKDMGIAQVMNLFVEIQQHTKNPYGSEACYVIRTDVFKSLGGFDPKIPFSEGPELLRRAKVDGCSMQTLRQPRFYYSLRRFRKQGTLQIARAFAEIELKRLMTGVTPSDTAAKLYPMAGGSNYLESPKTTIEAMFARLSKIKQLPEQVKKILLEDVL